MKEKARRNAAFVLVFIASFAAADDSETVAETLTVTESNSEYYVVGAELPYNQEFSLRVEDTVVVYSTKLETTIFLEGPHVGTLVDYALDHRSRIGVLYEKITEGEAKHQGCGVIPGVTRDSGCD